MNKCKWVQEQELPKPGQMMQLRLFPLTEIEILTRRVMQFEERMTEKLEAQRKGQFGKIGRNEKLLKEILERLEILEAGLCRNELVSKPCEIFEMALM